METGRHFVSYIGVAVFILVCEYSNARPTMDSLYGDHVYSGVIIPISGAIPRKIHSHEHNSHKQNSLKQKSSTGTSATEGMKSQTEGMKSQSNARPAMDSLYGDYVYSGATHPISGESNTDTSTIERMKSQNSNSNISPGSEEMKAQKLKKIFDMLGIDLSQNDLNQIDGTHKFDGKDSLQPSLCHDTYNDRYGVGKHFVRGARDVGFAIVSGAENLVDGLLGDLPLVPNITSGVGGGLKAIICAIEDGFSDIGSDIDSVLDIAKNGLVDFFKLKGAHPVLDIPAGIGGIATDTVKAAGQLVGDTVGGVKNAVGEILDA